MKIYTMNPTIDVVETPVEETSRIIRHLHLGEGKMIPEHKADALVTVVCLEGKDYLRCVFIEIYFRFIVISLCLRNRSPTGIPKSVILFYIRLF